MARLLHLFKPASTRDELTDKDSNGKMDATTTASVRMR
jgi:hypothetical protein